MIYKLILCSAFIPYALFASNGAGYGGGESPVLKTAVVYLGTTLHRIRLGADLELLGSADGCSKVKEPSLCRTMGSLSTQQKAAVKTFILTQNSAFLEALAKLKIEFSSEALSVPGPDGKTLSVAARTKLGPDGEVTVHEGSASSLSAYGMMALLTHELGHKIVSPSAKNKFLEDNEAAAPFKRGREFLDAVGATLALYLVRVEGRVPVTTVDQCFANSVSDLLNHAKFFGNSTDRDTASINPGAIEPSEPVSQFLAGIHSKDFTLATWVKYERTSDEKPTAQLILSNINYELKSPTGLEIARLKNGHLGVLMGGGSLIDTGEVFEPGEFHHVALRREGEKVSVFIDGKMVKTATVKLPRLASETPFYFGRAAKPAAGYWEGNIAMAFLKDKALSDSEIKSQFHCPGKL